MQKFSGWLFLGFLLLYLLSAFGQIGLFFPTLLAWFAVAVYWPQLNRPIQLQAATLFALGLGLLAVAASQGTLLSLKDVLSANLPLLAMFSAVSFLALTNKTDNQTPLPKGTASILSSALGINLLGAIINLSIVFIAGDRLSEKSPLSDAQQKVLTRSFCAAAWWSPFFIATAVSITYVPGLQWSDTLLPGLVMSLIALGFTSTEVYLKHRDNFEGYPIKPDSLMIPLCLALLVIGLHFGLPDLSIILIITCLAPLAALAFNQGTSRTSVRQFINHKLPNVGGQFLLFLAAGVFSAGIKGILLAYPDTINLANFSFTTPVFATVLALMIIAGILGIHPVISISLASPLLLPLEPSPSQLGFLFLSSWAISTGSSPLSGVGLTMTGRYHCSSRRILQNNWYYALVMWLLSVAMSTLL
ncbi:MULTISPECIES: hypothetical protein [unclassified Agarivorans]|uniref:hypothetical protein n=1 Tax=unclassified Agarivorans TaxID=2636026 RepID=UPI003D7CCCA0